MSLRVNLHRQQLQDWGTLGFCHCSAVPFWRAVFSSECLVTGVLLAVGGSCSGPRLIGHLRQCRMNMVRSTAWAVAALRLFWFTLYLPNNIHHIENHINYSKCFFRIICTHASVSLEGVQDSYQKSHLKN